MISLCFEIIKSMPDVSLSILAHKKIGRLLCICDDFYATLLQIFRLLLLQKALDPYIYSFC